MERELEYWPPGATQPVPVRVSIGAPEACSEHEWECALTIDGFPDEPHYSKKMYGADPIDAISYALAIAPLHLRLMGQRGGRLTWNGGETLRFPSMFSEPSHDWRWTPSEGGEPRRLVIRIGLPERIDAQWSVLVTCMDCKTSKAAERRVTAGAWPQALERAATAVPDLLQEYVDKAGGGLLEEVVPAPACRAHDDGKPTCES